MTLRNLLLHPAVNRVVGWVDDRVVPTRFWRFVDRTFVALLVGVEDGALRGVTGDNPFYTAGLYVGNVIRGIAP